MEEEGLNQILGFDEQIQIYSKRVFSQVEMIEKMKNLNRIVAEIYPQTTIVIAQLNDHNYELMFPLEIYGPLGIFQLEMKVDFKKNEINLKAYLADNMGRIQIQQKLLRLQVCRYMMRINGNMRVGSFFLNPVHGFLGFNLQCEGYKKHLLFQTEIDEIEFGGYIKGLILTAVNSLRFHFLRILLLTNKIKIKDLDFYSDLFEERFSKEVCRRKLPSQSLELLDRIQKVVSENMHLPFTKDDNDIYGPILSKQVKTDQKVIYEIKPTQLNDLNVEKHHKINEGGFCDIFAKDILYTKLGAGNAQEVKRLLVIKKAKDENPEHIQMIIKESQILQQLAQKFDFQKEDKNIGKKYFTPTGCCPYIAQFYFVQTNPEILLMERYYYKSLDYYKVKMREVMSLSTRLFIAHNIAMALRYCHYYGVAHMDIKPENVLITKNMMTKLTDFGDAHQIFDPITNQQQDQTDMKSGKTFPYCAPEITKQDSVITTAYDIYSFGILLFELIFDRLPIGFNKEKITEFEERLNKQTYQVRYNEKYDKTLGPQKLMKYLGRMCLQCLQPNPAHRPQIDKIVLVLKDCLFYLDKVY